MIDWKTRFTNKYFWMGVIPLVLLLVTQVLAMFGVVVDLIPLQEQLLLIVATVFGIVGVIVDPTTSGISDKTEDTE